MATINYSVEYNVVAGYAKVEWADLTPGDVGQAFDCAGMQVGSVHNWGDFGGGTIFIQGSNELSPANFKNIADFGQNDGVSDFEPQQTSAAVGSIRPTLVGGSGTVSTAILLLA